MSNAIELNSSIIAEVEFTHKCIRCGNILLPGDVYCSECGIKLEDDI